MPGDLAPGDAFEIQTVWVARGPIGSDVTATMSVVDAAGNAMDLGEERLIGGWNGLPTGRWEADRFYDVKLAGKIPADAVPGTYTFRISLSPDGAGAACQPGCAFEVGVVTVR
jgi:hypothetical protein